MRGGFGMRDARYWMLDAGCWIRDARDFKPFKRFKPLNDNPNPLHSAQACLPLFRDLQNWLSLMNEKERRPMQTRLIAG